ncbi:unnamed protein product [Acanthosepion pharaonis]|uniref:Uncharacterized protein n=1 Tax=Acanthosepion pharaonis TaxID=158019 RepID=A0A812EVS8_ACAPH|nr:unnamed protein product [Sepia pharaonis]
MQSRIIAIISFSVTYFRYPLLHHTLSYFSAYSFPILHSLLYLPFFSFFLVFFHTPAIHIILWPIIFILFVYNNILYLFHFLLSFISRSLSLLHQLSFSFPLFFFWSSDIFLFSFTSAFFFAPSLLFLLNILLLLLLLLLLLSFNLFFFLFLILIFYPLLLPFFLFFTFLFFFRSPSSLTINFIVHTFVLPFFSFSLFSSFLSLRFLFLSFPTPPSHFPSLFQRLIPFVFLFSCFTTHFHSFSFLVAFPSSFLSFIVLIIYSPGYDNKHHPAA